MFSWWFNDDEEWDEEEAGYDDGCSVGHEVEAEEWEEGCSDDRGQRDVTGEKEDDEEDSRRCIL